MHYEICKKCAKKFEYNEIKQIFFKHFSNLGKDPEASWSGSISPKSKLKIIKTQNYKLNNRQILKKTINYESFCWLIWAIFYVTQKVSTHFWFPVVVFFTNKNILSYLQKQMAIYDAMKQFWTHIMFHERVVSHDFQKTEQWWVWNMFYF